MKTNDLQRIVIAENSGDRLFCDEVSGKFAVSYGVYANLMLNLMSVEI